MYTYIIYLYIYIYIYIYIYNTYKYIGYINIIKYIKTTRHLKSIIFQFLRIFDESFFDLTKRYTLQTTI